MADGGGRRVGRRPAQRDARGADGRVRRRAGLAGHDRQRGGRRPDRRRSCRSTAPAVPAAAGWSALVPMRGSHERRSGGRHFGQSGELQRSLTAASAPARLCALRGLRRAGLRLLFARVALPRPARPPQIVGIRVGLADRYKAGLWTPVEVTLRGGSEACRGRVCRSSCPTATACPAACRRRRSPLPAPARPGDARCGSYVRFGRVHGTLTVEFRVGRQRRGPARPSRRRCDGRRRALPAGAGIASVDRLRGRRRRAAGRGGARWAASSRSSGRSWRALDDIERTADALVRLRRRRCGGALAPAGRKSTASLAAGSAADRGAGPVGADGRAAGACVGGAGREVLADGGPLRRFAPGRLARMVSLRQTGGAGELCGSPSRCRWPAAASRCAMPRLADVEGMVEAREADLPLVIRTARGFGQVIFLAADLDQPPLDQLDRPPAAGGQAARTCPPTARDRAKRTLGHDALRLSPTWPASCAAPGSLRRRAAGAVLARGGLVVGYILLIGPGDYFFLRKLVGRMEWTWLTFPLVVVVVSVAAYVLAYRLKGDQLRVNQVDLVDVDAASGRVRGTSWLNVFSPRMESFDLSVAAAAARRAAPADDAGGADGLAGPARPGPGRHEPAARPARSAGASRLQLLARIWTPCSACRSRSGRPRASPPAGALGRRPRPSGRAGRRGPAARGHDHQHLGFPAGAVHPGLRPLGLRDGHARARRSRPELGTDDQAERAEDAADRPQAGAATDDGDEQVSPGGHASTTRRARDPPYILRTMMFYEAAGGRRYTGLTNDYQGFVDLSDLLKTDRAVLVAQARRRTTPAPPPRRRSATASRCSAARTSQRDGRPLRVRRPAASCRMLTASCCRVHDHDH